MKGPHKYIKTSVCVGLLSSCVHCALHWGSAPVNCVPTGTEPLAVGWRSRARSAPTTCLVPGRVTGLLQGGPPRWAGGVACACVWCVLCVCDMWGWGAVAACEEGKPGGAGSKLVPWTSRSQPQEGVVLRRRSDWDGRGLVWAMLPPGANGNLHVLPSVCLSVCLSICILN